MFIAPVFHDLGYRVVVPDLLGYGGTSKPLDVKLYTFGYQAQDLIELLDSLGIKEVIPVGHDWGSGLAQRIYHFFPERVVALVLLSVAYFPPGKEDSPRDPVAANDEFERVDGYRRFQYQEHFIEDDAPKIWDEHLESAWTAIHGSDQEMAMKLYCQPGNFREYISNDRRDNPVYDFVKNLAIRDPWIKSMREGGFAAPFHWYRAFWENVHSTPEKDLPAERAKVDVPVLYMYCEHDIVCLGSDVLPFAKQGLLLDLTMYEIADIGHWVPYQRSEELNRLMKEWLEKKGL
ncbi:hypothetical protein PRZ48_011742 [Zasmidium cellare]|uniref:AB hydrolase-1 domain-containing protein n=1 Tax=Zasmidium cellare TaxID=395010 RepID=A0ABR0E784_ZASCE|nr:hypothetical protein PRZ48_011742 [Zasmidium cellare]